MVWKRGCPGESSFSWVEDLHFQPAAKFRVRSTEALPQMERIEGCVLVVLGLSDWVGHALSRALTDVSATTSLIIICTVTAFATEFASNTATANILAPILVETSKKLCLNPIFIGGYYAVRVIAYSLTCSCSIPSYLVLLVCIHAACSNCTKCHSEGGIWAQDLDYDGSRSRDELGVHLFHGRSYHGVRGPRVRLRTATASVAYEWREQSI